MYIWLLWRAFHLIRDQNSIYTLQFGQFYDKIVASDEQAASEDRIADFNGQHINLDNDPNLICSVGL